VKVKRLSSGRPIYQWTPEDELELLAYMRQHPELSTKRCVREWAREKGYPWHAVDHLWYDKMRPRGIDRPAPEADPAAAEAAAVLEPSVGDEIRRALLRLAQEDGRLGRLTAADLEQVARRFGVSYATVLACWGQLHATGQVLVTERAQIARELEETRARVRELEEEVARLRRELEVFERLRQAIQSVLGV
jgi:hypothetical protein